MNQGKNIVIKILYCGMPVLVISILIAISPAIRVFQRGLTDFSGIAGFLISYLVYFLSILFMLWAQQSSKIGKVEVTIAILISILMWMMISPVFHFTWLNIWSVWQNLQYCPGLEGFSFSYVAITSGAGILVLLQKRESI